MHHAPVRRVLVTALVAAMSTFTVAAAPAVPLVAGTGSAGLTLAAAASRAVKAPVRGTRAARPPAGAKASTKLRFDPGLTWKSDPRSHAVFAVGAGRQVWFIDATSGWPYTIDATGEVFTADPKSGTVYSLGRLSSWAGDLLFLFSFWDLDGGRYLLPAYDTWVTYYEDETVDSFGWEETWEEVWEYEEFYASDEFDDLELALLEAEADALDAEAEALAAEEEALAAEEEALAAEEEALAAEEEALAAEEEAADLEDESGDWEDDGGDDWADEGEDEYEDEGDGWDDEEASYEDE